MARILIVEDEPEILVLAESVLQSAGHEAVSAGTVAEAQAIINDPDQKLDLVFTDVELGAHKEGGFAVGRLVGEMREGTPVLYTSGRPPPMECLQCLRSRARISLSPTRYRS